MGGEPQWVTPEHITRPILCFDPPLQSALGAVPSNATGFVHRDALFTIQYGVDWQTPEQAAANGLLSLASGLQARLDPYFAPTAVRSSLPRWGGGRPPPLKCFPRQRRAQSPPY